MKTVYFVRHGQSETNAAKVFNGGINSLLTERGREQARETAKTVKEVVGHPDVIIASPQLRTKETAEIIAKTIGYPVEAIEYDKRLLEAHAGRYAGRSKTPEAEALLNQDRVRHDNQNEVEWIEAVRDRTQAFVDDLAKRKEAVILLVGHNTGSRMLRRVFGNIASHATVPALHNAAVLQLYPDIKVSDDGEYIGELL